MIFCQGGRLLTEMCVEPELQVEGTKLPDEYGIKQNVAVKATFPLTNSTNIYSSLCGPE